MCGEWCLLNKASLVLMNIWNILDKEDPMPSQLCKNIIFVATPEQLSCRLCYSHLWITAVSLHLSSGGWITAIDALFRDAEHLGIEFRHPNGTPFVILDTCETFPEENEAGRRWVTNFKKADSTRICPRYHCRCFQKLLCIELVLQCTVSMYQRGPDTPRCSFTHMPLGW